MKKYIIPVLALLAVGCTKDFKDFNTNPYGATDEQLSRIPQGGNELVALQKLVVPQQENSYQMCFDLPATPYAGYASQPKFQADYPVYNPRTGWTDYVFDDTYTKHLYPAFFALKSYSKGDMSKYYFAWGTVLRVAITHWLTDSYGPLPYSKMEAGKTQTPYDKQSDLYKYMAEDLKAAINTLKAVDASDRQYADFDLVYKGDMTKWVKYANSLLLRIAIRMSDVDETNAKAYAQFAINNGVITENADNAMLETQDNSVFKVAVSWNDSRAGADIVAYMNTFSDPRREVYFTEVAGLPQKYIGLRSGAPAITIDPAKFSAPKLTKESPMVWITASEVAFIKAEMALKGWGFVGDTAENLYKKGIELSFAQHNVAIGNYLNNTSVRGAYYDPRQSAYNNPTFSSAITVKWDDSASNEVKLSKIITQKWIAMYPYNSHEAWAEWRRTGYPNLMAPVENRSNGVITSVNQVNGKDTGGMRRLPFSSKETTNNPTNRNAAVGYLGGADNGATDLWWVKK
jgi:hypothetical protein